MARTRARPREYEILIQSIDSTTREPHTHRARTLERSWMGLLGHAAYLVAREQYQCGRWPYRVLIESPTAEIKRAGGQIVPPEWRRIRP